VPGEIRVDLSGSRIRIERGPGTEQDLWRSLGRNIAPDDHIQTEQTIEVPLERFLATRNWLASTLRSYGCAVAFTETATTAVEVANAERAELVTLLDRGFRPVDPEEVELMLGTSRFSRELMWFQLRDLAHLLSLSHGANFSVPGAGKTTVAYALYEYERMRNRVDRLLVVAPLSAFEAWTSEAIDCFAEPLAIRRFGDSTPRSPEVQLLNYHGLSNNYNEASEWVTAGRTHVILDEAHRMKRGRTGDWGSRCLDLAHLAVRRDILTGTPAPQHPRDFEALTGFLWPNQTNLIIPRDALRLDPPPHAMATLSDRLEPLFARTDKGELGLDDPIVRVEAVTMGPVQREIYEALRTRMRFAIQASPRERAQFGQMGEVLMYLLQAATNPALLSVAVNQTNPNPSRWPPAPFDANSDMAARVLDYPQLEIPTKVQKLATMVASNAADGRKTLVWSNFVRNLDNLATAELAPFNPVVVHGSVPSSADVEDPRTREHAIRRFRTDPECMVLLANPAAMSEGVSLHHECHDAIYVDRTFNAGQYLQSIDRIHRLGLPPGIDTRITILACGGTVDDAVDSRVEQKAERLSVMLKDPSLMTMALPDDELGGEIIDVEDLDSLFAHLEQ
jgi:SNF2 family DNA or RNA helicase